MKRSTKMAPDSLSTSYFTGSAFIGISMITLKASGTCLPGETRSRDMVLYGNEEAGEGDYLRLFRHSSGVTIAMVDSSGPRCHSNPVVIPGETACAPPGAPCSSRCAGLRARETF